MLLLHIERQTQGGAPAHPLFVGPFITRILLDHWLDHHNAELNDGDFMWIAAYPVELHSQFGDTWKNA